MSPHERSTLATSSAPVSPPPPSLSPITKSRAPTLRAPRACLRSRSRPRGRHCAAAAALHGLACCFLARRRRPTKRRRSAARVQSAGMRRASLALAVARCLVRSSSSSRHRRKLTQAAYPWHSPFSLMAPYAQEELTPAVASGHVPAGRLDMACDMVLYASMSLTLLREGIRYILASLSTIDKGGIDVSFGRRRGVHCGPLGGIRHRKHGLWDACGMVRRVPVQELVNFVLCHVHKTLGCVEDCCNSSIDDLSEV
mmetsp:Transcript_42909/g.100567  ORF Transcript_42909/g.100567 Transcript_42909/m.100567 type:complete len:255 (-) Transcript_42909:12-776(-)